MSISRAHHLNLYSKTDDSIHSLDIEADDTLVTIGGAAGTVKFANALALTDSTNGDVANVSTKLYALEAAISSGNAAASALVQTNLDDYETSNNSALAVLTNTVVTNKSISDANHSFDADARTALNTALAAALQTEEDARVAAAATLTSSISTEASNRATAITNEATTRAAADTALQNAIDVEKGRIDAILASADVSLDTLKEIADAFASADTSTLSTVATINAQLQALQSVVDDLVSS